MQCWLGVGMKLCITSLTTKELFKDIKGAAVGFTPLSTHAAQTPLQACLAIPVTEVSICQLAVHQYSEHNTQHCCRNSKQSKYL